MSSPQHIVNRYWANNVILREETGAVRRGTEVWQRNSYSSHNKFPISTDLSGIKKQRHLLADPVSHLCFFPPHLEVIATDLIHCRIIYWRRGISIVDYFKDDINFTRCISPILLILCRKRQSLNLTLKVLSTGNYFGLQNNLSVPLKGI